MEIVPVVLNDPMFLCLPASWLQDRIGCLLLLLTLPFYASVQTHMHVQCKLQQHSQEEKAPTRQQDHFLPSPFPFFVLRISCLPLRHPHTNAHASVVH